MSPQPQGTSEDFTPQYHYNIPYSTTSPLNTLDICLPRRLSASDPSKTIWIIYIHGGAWRDPLLTSSELRTALALFFPSHPPRDIPSNPSPTWAGATTASSSAERTSNPIPHIAGFASINYRLSPYPAHSTHPSLDGDGSRNVQHPAHVRDIADALAYLKDTYNVGRLEGGLKKWDHEGYEYIGIGHSCGATLWAQLTAYIGIVEAERKSVPRPVALGLMAGIYNLRGFVSGHADIAAYREIVEGAFGADEKGWGEASPVEGNFSREAWTGGRVVLLAASAEDGLVEEAQREGMLEKFKEDCWEVRKGIGSQGVLNLKGERRVKREDGVVLWDMEGEHDGHWGDGWQLKWLIEELVLRTVQENH